MRIKITILAICMLFPPIFSYAVDSRFTYVINNDESKVPQYTLPDPLTLENGKQVKSVKVWETKRRPEILRMFSEQMFGTAPGKPADVSYELVSVDKNAFDGLATRKVVRIHLNSDKYITVLIHLPNGLGKPAPMFAGLNFNGNDGTLEGQYAYRWPYRTILNAGFGVATAWRDEIEEDSRNRKNNGIRDLYGKEYTWGSIAGWAWTLSRIMDYMETDSEIDAEKVAVIGHSRLGKTALWAGATDPRFALVISNDSGCAGAALSKRVFGENLDAIQQKFPHWFCKNLLKYSRNEQALPFDQHELLSLIAPRPLYVASASADQWADPKGEWLSAYHASPVYELYGLKGLVTDGKMPDLHNPQNAGYIGYHIRAGRHAILPYDWDQYILFARKHLLHDEIPPYLDATLSAEERAADLCSRMTFDEKIGQIYQHYTGKSDNINNIGARIEKIKPHYGSLIYYGEDPKMHNSLMHFSMEKSRLGIPYILGYDAIHGYRTGFAIPLAQACSFNPEMAGKANRMCAEEAYAGGVDWTFSPMVDIARDPRWGRISEGYGEDPCLASAFSAAAVRAYQGDDLSKPGNIAACLKHYVGYGASEAGRDYVPTEISRQSLWDTYLPPFKAGIDAGCVSVMSAFNTLSGVPASGNHYTLTEVLKNRWNINGFVVSDWGSVRQLVNQGVAADSTAATRIAFNAGVDMDMCDNHYTDHMKRLVDSGEVKLSDIDAAVLRILKVKFRLGLFDNPYRPDFDPETPPTAEHRAVSLALARECPVLLKNNGILPLSTSAKIAVIGPVADDPDAILGNWRSHARFSEATSYLQGLKKVFRNVAYARGCDYDGLDESGIQEAVTLAGKSDAVVLCIGEKAKWSGENCSRSTITLPQIQQKLLEAVKACGKPVVAVLTNGRSLNLVNISPSADAVLEMWQTGICAGDALAELLSGKCNPSGKLAVTFPYTDGQIPIYYNRRSRARSGTQGYYQDIQVEPMYDFGYGLSYSKFKYSDITLNGLTATVKVTNTSDVDGKETVLWFITDKACSIARPVKELKHFEKRLIPAGKTEVFTFEIDKLRDLGFVDADGNTFFESGDFILNVAGKTLQFNVK